VKSKTFQQHELHYTNNSNEKHNYSQSMISVKRRRWVWWLYVTHDSWWCS